MIAKLSLCNCSQYLQKVQKLFFIFYSHVIWKFDEKCHLSLWCSSFPSPMLRRKSANCENSPRSFALMFCVGCNLVTICQRYEDFSVASTISGLDPCRTTGTKQRLKMSSKKLIQGGDFTFQMTEIINFWICFCSFKIGPWKISSPALHGGYFC